MVNYLAFSSFLHLVIIVCFPHWVWTASMEFKKIASESNNNHTLLISSLERLQPLNRLTRSTMPTKMGYARQRCPGCILPEIGSQCTPRSRLLAKRYSQQLKCQPEPTLVKLELHRPDYSLEPSVAKVKRCSGFCRPSFHSCVPSETSFVKVPVMLIHHSTMETRCVEYEVEQHESCFCGCEVQNDHCLDDVHKHEHCSCKCLDEELKDRCLEEAMDSNAVWDEDKCTCICEPKACEDKFVWNPQQCRCEMLITGIDAENLLY